MLKILYSEVEKYFIIRLIDNIFFIAGAVFLLLGLYNANNILSIYGLAMMFISLYVLQHLYNYHPIGKIHDKKELIDEHNLIIAELNTLVSNEKKLRQDMEKNKREILRLVSKIKDADFYNKIMARLRAEKHAEERKKRVLDEDMRRALLMLGPIIETLPKEQRSKFIKSRNYKFYKNVMGRVK